MDRMILVNFQVKEKFKNKIEISPKLAQQLQIDSGEELNLRVGLVNIKINVFIRKSNYNPSSIDIAMTNLKKLYLKVDQAYGIAKQGEQIKIGPVVGIMAERFTSGKRPYKSQTDFFDLLVSTGHNLGQICYVFSPYDINWKQKTVQGYQIKAGKWKKDIYPLPDVIYLRQSGYIKNMQLIRKRLKKAGCIFINPPLIGKWNAFKILTQNQAISKYVPDTKLIREFKSVEKMVKKYKAVYMKPVEGSKGKNIIRVIKKEDLNIYEYEYQLNNKMYAGRVSSINDLQRSLKLIMGTKRYIVQRQIDLLRIDDRVVDIRIMVQKNQTGKWVLTGKACRIGGKDSITSNIAAGGNALNVDKVINSYFKDRLASQRIINEVESLALSAAKELEKSHGLMGELGIDIGVDDKGLIWFIEANMQPGRQVFRLMDDLDTRKLSIERPLVYARYLAGFENNDNDLVRKN